MTTGFPIDNSGTEDVGAAETLSNENGTTCRYVDFPPNSISPMHRTTSLDYGESQHTLDSSSLTPV